VLTLGVRLRLQVCLTPVIRVRQFQKRVSCKTMGRGWIAMLK
jgi:hypothetical protein